jgi:aminopeptidase N
MWRRLHLVPLLLMTLSPAQGALGQTPPPEGTGWTTVRLDLEVTVDHAGQELHFSGRARLRLDADSSTGPALSLNSRVPALRYTRLDGPGGSARLNQTVPGDSAVRLARLRFPRVRHRGDEIEIQFAYVPDRESLQLIMGPRVALASWVENWYPTPLTPDGYTAAAAAAPGITRFHLPRDWRAVSNGRPEGRQTAAAGTTETWVVDQPVARSFAAGPYVVARKNSGRRQISVFLLSASGASAGAQARTLDRALGAMERRFGPYPYPSYAIAEVPESVVTWAASSEQGFIMAKTSMIAVPGGNLPLFAHEAAHGWWGNAVTTSGPGSKLGSEALAQYGAVIAIEALEGRAAMREFLRFSRAGYNPRQCALGYFSIWRLGGDKPLALLEDDRWDHNLADSKGMWFYHMTRQRLGDAAFFDALRGLLAGFRNRSMTVQDIRQAFNRASPMDAGLPAFLDQWLDRPGAPVLDVDWWAHDLAPADSSPDFGATVRVRQRQQGEAFVLDLEVALTLQDSTRVLETLHVRQRDETFQLGLQARPLELRVDPAYRLLTWRPEYGPRPGGGRE